MRKGKKPIYWITNTAVLIALLVTLQWATAPTQGFAGQYITGTCVNAVLMISVLLFGWSSGVVVALASPFCAFMLGIGPALLPIVPAVAVGNLVLVLTMHFLVGQKRQPLWKTAAAVITAAFLKFASLFLLVNKLIVPLMADTLKPQQVKAFAAMFSWGQMITAVLGGVLMIFILPVLRKALSKE